MDRGRKIRQWRTNRQRLIALAKQRIQELGLKDNFDHILVAATGNDEILLALLDLLEISDDTGDGE